jgi:hypothetical protein
MPATYEPIATTTLGSAAANITFSSIPATYTDLRLVIVAKSVTTDSVNLRLNSDSSSIYTYTLISGNGSSASSSNGGGSSYNRLYLNYNAQNSSSQFSLYEVDFFSYAGSTFKTALVKASQDFNGSGCVEGRVSLYRSTSAINAISFFGDSYNLAVGTTATLYGIKNA